MYPDSCYSVIEGWNFVKFLKDGTFISSNSQTATYRVVDEKNLIIEVPDGGVGCEYSFFENTLTLSAWVMF